MLLGFPGLAPHYEIVLSRDGPLDEMTIEVERAPDVPGEAAVRAA